jgi:hypothetical protein
MSMLCKSFMNGRWISGLPTRGWRKLVRIASLILLRGLYCRSTSISFTLYGLPPIRQALGTHREIFPSSTL